MDILQLLELSNYFPARIILTAAELGMFSHLLSPSSAEEIAEECGGLAIEGTARILNALAGMGFIRKSGEKYFIPDEFVEFLGDGPKSVVPMLLHRLMLWDRWDKLSEIVRTGKNFYELYPMETDPVERQHAFSRAMAVAGRQIALQTAEALDFDGIEKILDIGGAPGIYAIEFMKVKKGLNISILDRPGADDIIRERTNGTEFEGRIGFIEGDALDVHDSIVTSDGKFDMVFMSNLIHSMSPDEIRFLFKRCVGWIRPGGRIAVKDFFLDDDRTTPSRASIFAINMLVSTPGGNSYTWSEVEQWLREIALDDGSPAVESTSRISVGDGMDGIIVARLAG